MHTTDFKKFKGEIENYVNNRNNIFESRIDRAFSALNFRTNLSRTNIRKKGGYHAAHLLFILTMLCGVGHFRYRTRYFTDSGIIGTKESASQLYQGFKDHFSSKHGKRPRLIQGLHGVYPLKRLSESI